MTLCFRCFSRTLTSVHNAILEDLCYPAEIVGKRTRVRLDGSHLIKVHLDKNQQTNVEHKVTTKPLSLSLSPALPFSLSCWLMQRRNIGSCPFSVFVMFPLLYYIDIHLVYKIEVVERTYHDTNIRHIDINFSDKVV